MPPETTTEKVTKHPPSSGSQVGAAIIFVAVFSALLCVVVGEWDEIDSITATISGGREVFTDGRLTPSSDLIVTVSLGTTARLGAALIAGGLLLATGGGLLGFLDASRKVETVTKLKKETGEELALAEATAVGEVVKSVVEPLTKATPATGAIVAGLLLALGGLGVAWQNASVANSILESTAVSPPTVVTTTTVPSTTTTS